MKPNSIEFSLDSKTELLALTALIQGLNLNGVPYSLAKDTIAIRLTISTGC